ncbi:MAG: hypothetical protein LBC87_11675 [Fibromonadaceae bacterium]|jgi:hypothetical protein|nr:hypothetical protein [Fibromonadaceae bacterium]
MKKILFLLFLLFIAGDEAWAKGNSAIWNGKTDIKWYSNSKTEFTITTPEQLAGLAKLVNKGNDFKGKTVKLGANIMLNDTVGWQNWEKKKPKNKWKPIGFHKYTSYGHIGHLMLSDLIDNYFNGTFDGGGFAVSGVYVNEPDGTYIGLFGNVQYGVIKNLGVTASYISGGSQVGGLVGFIRDSKIINCHSNALVIGREFSVGGLAGEVNGYDSRIVSSYSTGTVTGRKIIGGLVGMGSGEIINSYSSATVTGKEYVGGLVGIGSYIISSYSSGTITGDSYVGGLVGCINHTQITNSYSIGAVTGRSKVGGLVGNVRYDEGKVTNSYYSKETSGQSDKGKGEGKTTAEMRKKETFEGWDFDRTWEIDGKVNGGYPYLSSLNHR